MRYSANEAQYARATRCRSANVASLTLRVAGGQAWAWNQTAGAMNSTALSVRPLICSLPGSAMRSTSVSNLVEFASWVRGKPPQPLMSAGAARFKFTLSPNFYKPKLGFLRTIQQPHNPICPPKIFAKNSAISTGATVCFSRLELTLHGSPALCLAADVVVLPLHTRHRHRQHATTYLQHYP